MNDQAKDMLEKLRGDEKQLLEHLGQLRRSIAETEAHIHRTQGAIAVVEKMLAPVAESVAAE